MSNSYVDELRKLKGGEAPKQFYHFAESCPYLERELLDVLMSKIGDPKMSKVDADLSEMTPMDFKFLVTSGSLLSSGKLVLVSGAEELKGDAGKEVVQALEEANPQNTIVFMDNEIPKTTSLGKFVSAKAHVITDTGLNDKMLLAWAKRRFKDRGCDVSDEAVSALIERTLGDMVALAGEIEKLSAFAGEGATVTKQDVDSTTQENPEIVIFRVTDALSSKNIAKGVRLLRQLVRSGEPPERVSVMLYNHFMRILIAKELKAEKATEKEIAEKLKCHPFVAKKATESAAGFTRDELISYLAQIQEADVAMKTGLSEPLFAIETALFQLVGSAKRL